MATRPFSRARFEYVMESYCFQIKFSLGAPEFSLNSFNANSSKKIIIMTMFERDRAPLLGRTDRTKITRETGSRPSTRRETPPRRPAAKLVDDGVVRPGEITYTIHHHHGFESDIKYGKRFAKCLACTKAFCTVYFCFSENSCSDTPHKRNNILLYIKTPSRFY